MKNKKVVASVIHVGFIFASNSVYVLSCIYIDFSANLNIKSIDLIIKYICLIFNYLI